MAREEIEVSNLSAEWGVGDIVVRYVLPAGLVARQPPLGADGRQEPAAGDTDGEVWVCPGSDGASVIVCTYVPGFVVPFGTTKTLVVNVDVAPEATGTLHGSLTVAGGGAEAAEEVETRTVVSSTPAKFGVRSFSGGAFSLDGRPASQAGGHPDVTTDIQFATEVNADGLVTPARNVKDVTVALPKGLVGDPTAYPQCTTVDLNAPGNNAAECPVESQVGVARVVTNANGGGAPVAVYNVVPPEGAPARFAFNLFGVIVNIDPEVRTGGDYGVTAHARRASQTLTLFSTRLTLWGVPADSSHDFQRFKPGINDLDGSPTPSAAVRRPFMTAPTECSGAPLATGLVVAPWQNPADVQTASFDHDFLGNQIRTEGCELLSFRPTVDLKASTSRPDAPTGMDVAIRSPQNLDNPDGLASAHLRDVVVGLPEGLTVNPGAADGLEACSDAQLGLGNDVVPSCPDGSRIGSVSAKSPLLDETLEGGVYIRSQNSDDPESGEMFRLALVVRNEERGILVKLPGSVKANKDTGRLTATFKDNPQLPVESIDLRLKSGPRAPLATPGSCGSKTTEIDMTSWAGGAVKASDAFDVACTAGLGGFAPTVTAGTVNPIAGGRSPFVVDIAKPDGNAVVNGLRMALPAGLLAKLKGNLGTQVGTVRAFAGPGSNPFVLPGKVLLEGQYGDAPFSLRVVVPAKAGPFDLGEVVVRQKIYVDPITAQVTVVSDPIPTIVKGVPARLQRLEVSVDKPDFIINPTSCEAKTIGGTLSAADAQTAPINVRFRVGGCAALDLKPNLALTLSGKGQTTDGKHPAVTANVTQPAGQANLKKVRVALPLSLALDVDNANGLCEFVDGSKVTPTCPKASIVGTATATTPILNQSLTGPVYFVKNVRKNPRTGRDVKTLPKLVIPLVGENGLKLTLTGTSDVEDDQLVTTFDNIPDAPVSSFKLNINGGKSGILAVSGADICKSTQIADQQIDGQNGKAADADIYIQTPSCALKVLSKKVGKRSVTMKVSGLGAGKVTVTGKGIKKTTKTISKSTVATITAKRTKGKPGKVKVSFDPTGAKKARSVSVSLAVSAAK
jgi:hypothetical protein